MSKLQIMILSKSQTCKHFAVRGLNNEVYTLHVYGAMVFIRAQVIGQKSFSRKREREKNFNQKINTLANHSSTWLLLLQWDVVRKYRSYSGGAFWAF